MHPYGGRGSRGNSPAKRKLLPEHNAAGHELALKWREEWRAEKFAASLQPGDTQAAAAPKFGGNQRQHRAKFAQAIARLELGKAYWDERRQRESRKPTVGSFKPARKPQ